MEFTWSSHHYNDGAFSSSVVHLSLINKKKGEAKLARLIWSAQVFGVFLANLLS